ncbi:SH3 domain-containing protein [Streptomyces sp. NPDC001530]|uniref:SH3 domain-containing protein n=1 Tax=Streptomyces sp. NPDC001530 TaxID=3364582 RepID=UPI0036A92F41
MKRIKRVLGVVTLTASLAVGGGMALAPGATAATAAVGSSACNGHYGNGDSRALKVTASGVNLRTGPATSYGSKGLLNKGDTASGVCWKTKSGRTWLYVKLSKKTKSGLPKGTYGWVYSSYVKES